jgi:hypothetical protein
MIFGLRQEATEHRYALNLSDDTRRGKRRPRPGEGEVTATGRK